MKSLGDWDEVGWKDEIVAKWFFDMVEHFLHIQYCQEPIWAPGTVLTIWYSNKTFDTWTLFAFRGEYKQ